MKQYLFAFSSVVMAAIFYVVFTGAGPFGVDPKAKEEAIISAVKSHLQQVHYAPQEIDDNFSAKVMDLFMESLDGSKRFLTRNEVKSLSIYRDQLDDQLENNQLIFFDQANTIIEAAIVRGETVFEEMIDFDFDFTKSGEIQMDSDKREFSKNEKQLREMWKNILKYDILSKYDNAFKKQEKRQKKVADGTASEEQIEMEDKTQEELLIDAREEVKDDFEKWFDRLSKVRRSDRFESYVNAITHVYDPHSVYYNPKEKQDFDIRMRGKLEGIGARLSTDGDFTKVVSIVVGGPAWKGKELVEGDIITGVTQKGGEPVSIEGMRIDDVVQKIRGKKGSVVILTVKKVDGSMSEITIIRDIVITEEGNAKSTIIEMDGTSEKIGYIYLPSFYADFKDDDGRSCAKDIAAELAKLKAENVDGIIMDIRNNGGGSLRDVVEMGGLFIEEGPIVQVKPKGRKPRVLEDDDSTVQYDGPLIIMVNEYSVSASEILAAALQDYNRALIVGSNSTFGKGTVQRFFNLDQVRGAQEFKPLGEVKLTIQKFFRINGTSTQLRGVVPDIILPDYFQFVKTGEKDYDYPLEWNEIESVPYTQNAYVIKNYEELRAKSKARISNDPTFQLIEENAKRLKRNQDDRVYPLSLIEYTEKMNEREEEAKKFKVVGKDLIEGLSVINLEADMAHIQADSSRIARNDVFLEKLAKDVYLKETLHIMDDMIEN